MTDSHPLEPILEVRNLSVEVRTEQGWIKVVEGLDLQLVPGETLGLVGESGSGKTMTALAIMGVLPGVARVGSGEVHFDGQDLLLLNRSRLAKLRGNEISMIFQDAMRALHPAFTVGGQIVEVLREHETVTRKNAWKRAIELFDMVGIPNAAKRVKDYPFEFSGGMSQRVMIAMAVACHPKVLIADEPTTALDVTVQQRVLDLLEMLKHELHMSLVIVSHDLGVIGGVADRVQVMYAGQSVEVGPIRDVFAEPIHPYTSALFGSLPPKRGRGAQFESIPGAVPSPSAMPTGCHFAPRCPYALDRCNVPVPLAEVGFQRASRCVRNGELDLKGAIR